MVSIILLIYSNRKRIITLAFVTGVVVILGVVFYFVILKNQNVMLEDDDGIPGVMISGKRYAFFHKPAIVPNETLVHNLGCVVVYEKSKFPQKDMSTNCIELVGCIYAQYGLEIIIKVNNTWYYLDCLEYYRSSGGVNNTKKLVI
jgi:hypothetical protein